MKEYYICASRGREFNNRWTQKLEIRESVCNALTTVQKDNMVMEVNMENDTEYRIRKLTPNECWRLMGFSDQDFEKAKNALNKTHYKGKDRSNSQLYKQAGNSIVTDVLYYIFKELYDAMPYLFDDLKLSSYFSGIGAFEVGLDKFYEDINGKSDGQN